MGEKETDLGRVLGAPWYVRLGLKLGRGGIVSKVMALFTGRPGLLRTILLLYILALIVLPIVHLPGPAQVLAAVFTFLGLATQAAGAPVDHGVLAKAINDWIVATLALVAALRPLVRWVVAGWRRAGDLGSVPPPGPLQG